MNFKVGDIISTGGNEYARITRIATFSDSSNTPSYLVHSELVGNFWMDYELVYKYNIEVIIKNRDNKINEILNEEVQE